MVWDIILEGTEWRTGSIKIMSLKGDRSHIVLCLHKLRFVHVDKPKCVCEDKGRD